MAVRYAPPFTGTCDTCGTPTLVDCHVCGRCVERANPEYVTKAWCGCCGNVVNIVTEDREYARNCRFYAEHRSRFGRVAGPLRRCIESGTPVHPGALRRVRRYR